MQELWILNSNGGNGYGGIFFFVCSFVSYFFGARVWMVIEPVCVAFLFVLGRNGGISMWALAICVYKYSNFVLSGVFGALVSVLRY